MKFDSSNFVWHFIASDFVIVMQIGFVIGYHFVNDFANFVFLLIWIVIFAVIVHSFVIWIDFVDLDFVTVTDIDLGHVTGSDFVRPLDGQLVDGHDEHNLRALPFRQDLVRQKRQLHLQHRACCNIGQMQIRETLHICLLGCKHHQCPHNAKTCGEDLRHRCEKRDCQFLAKPFQKCLAVAVLP